MSSINQNQFNLLTQRRFLPYFITQLLGAFNDNAFKMAVLTLIAFHLITQSQQVQYFQALGAGVFTLPFFLFSATAGQLADKYHKTLLIRIIKLFEIVFMLIGGIGLITNNIFLMFTTIFLMGGHSTFFGPIKYSILPEHLQTDELIAGNALVEAGTFIAILLGTILGALSIPSHKTYINQGLILVTLLLTTIAVCGFISSLFIPSTHSASPKLKINFNFLRATFDVIKKARENNKIFIAILGISWFWLLGTVFLAELPALIKYHFAANNRVFSLFLAIFTVGIACGSLLINRLLKGKITSRLAPLALYVMAFFILLLYFQTPKVLQPPPKSLVGIGSFIGVGSHCYLMLTLFFIALSGGLIVVPLYALIQHLSHVTQRSQIIAANNIFNAIFMVLASVMILFLAFIHLSIPAILLFFGILNIPVGIFLKKLL